ncbi:hypothetical protein R1539_000965 [Campylobacter upsaliensis]|nr:hypothetical protein [Campylobacter upsaliensis]
MIESFSWIITSSLGLNGGLKIWIDSLGSLGLDSRALDSISSFSCLSLGVVRVNVSSSAPLLISVRLAKCVFFLESISFFIASKSLSSLLIDFTSILFCSILAY